MKRKKKMAPDKSQPETTPVIDKITQTSPSKPCSSAIPLAVSLVLNGVLIIVCLITADRLSTEWNDGYYKGQIKTYQVVESLKYGKLTYRMTNSEFTFKEDKPMSYIYNRNYLPNALVYPDDKPPVIK
jgi:hypothetical protein